MTWWQQHQWWLLDLVIWGSVVAWGVARLVFHG